MTIVCATDFSDAAEPAEHRALDLARALGADLVLVHVLGDAPLYREGVPWALDLEAIYAEQRRWIEATLETRVTAAHARGVAARAVIRRGVPHAEILAAADGEKADMIVMGTHGRSGLDRLLLGSVAERVVRRAMVPVLTLRGQTALQRTLAEQKAKAPSAPAVM